MRPPAPAIVAFAAAMLLLPAIAAAAEPAADSQVGFERQLLDAPGLASISYINILLLLVFAAVAFYVCNWAFLDARFVNTNQAAWGAIVLAGAVAGLAAAVAVPIFFIGLPLGIILFGGAAVAYALHRNGLVTPALRVLTAAHLARLKRRLMGRKAMDDGTGPASAANLEIVFMGLDDLPRRLAGGPPAQEHANREVERVLYDAVRRGASAVGVVIRPQKAEVRFRVGGEMVAGSDVERPASDHFAATVKRLAGLDPNETRKPQQGRLRAVVAGHTMELRVKTAGTVRGEQIAVRIIDVQASQMKLDDIGLPQAHLDTLREALAAKPGLVIISGPKDSGLTTTLHACLRHFDRFNNNVMAFEPHVDLEVENVQHVVVNQEDGPVATAEVRSRIRMEPDIVAVDSLYVPEIAQILAETLKARSVLVSLRAADTSQAVERMAALFGSAQPLADRLQIVVNQRLVRLLCTGCREAYRPNPEFLRKANLGNRNVGLLYRPPTRLEAADGKVVVCPKCRNERYVGRTAIFEVMPVDAVAREMIGRGSSAADVRTYVRKLGMRNLQEEGLQLVIEGRTSIEEVLRAIKQAT